MRKILRSRILMWVSILALLAVTVGGTLALMAAQANTVTNQFTVADVDTEIEEVLTEGNKQVSIKNNGDSPVYVRARIMVSGVAASQVEVVSSTDAMSDPNKVYLVMAHQGKWQKDGSEADDFYYYLGVVQPGDSTANLLEKVVLGANLAGDTDFLNGFTVTIYHESVLAVGDIFTAFEAAGADDAT